MLYFLGIVAAIGGIAAMIYGAYLVYKNIMGETEVELPGGYKIKSGGGIVIFLCGLAALGFIYWKALENDTTQIAAERDGYKKKLDETDTELTKEKTERQAQAQGREKSEREASALRVQLDDASRRLASEAAERREAQEYATATWLANNRTRLTPAQQRELDQYTKGVLALNDSLSVLKIKQTAWPTLSGRNAVAIFEIYRRDFERDASQPRGAGLFQFQLEKYRIEGDSARGLPEELALGLAKLICDASTRAIVDNVTPRQAFAAIQPLARFEGDYDRVREVEDLQYVSMRLKMLAAESLILVRGYADGEQNHFERDLDPKLKQADVHENADPNRKPVDFALEFKPELTHVSVGLPSTQYARYGNVDLPNLRAAVTGEIVAKLVNTCSPPTNMPTGKIGVELLDGQIYEGKNVPDRKSRVHLLVFLKET
jgi:hypothetical protein